MPGSRRHPGPYPVLLAALSWGIPRPPRESSTVHSSTKPSPRLCGVMEEPFMRWTCVQRSRSGGVLSFCRQRGQHCMVGALGAADKRRTGTLNDYGQRTLSSTRWSFLAGPGAAAGLGLGLGRGKRPRAARRPRLPSPSAERAVCPPSFPGCSPGSRLIASPSPQALRAQGPREGPG